MPGMNNLGGALARQRLELGVSQDVLARTLHMSRDALGRLERGQRKEAPSLSELQRWAEALEMSVDELVALRAADYGSGWDTGHESVARIFSALPSDLPKSIAAASEEVSIWQTWIPSDLGLVEAIAAAAKRDVKIRLLLVDPTSSAALARARSLRHPHPEPYVRSQMTTLLSDLAASGAEAQALLRLTQDQPFLQMYRVDDRVVLGWFFPSRPSMVMPQVDMQRSSSLGSEVINAFDAEWAELPTPDLTQYTTG